MGQYHKVVNLTKREYIMPHKLGCGLKLWEQITNSPGTGAALLVLLACSNGRGGGDLKPDPIIGRWAGDKIAVVGDYAEEGDIEGCDVSQVYGQCSDRADSTYKDVSDDVAGVLERELEGKFEGDGRRTFKQNR